MSVSRRSILKGLALGLPALHYGPGALALKDGMPGKLPSGGDKFQVLQDGPFAPTRASLRAYQIPDWFRDAKFGIWAHWGPQSAVEYGDWYARNMYMQGEKQYDYHVKTYGHPSKFGFKDTIPNWTAEKFDPDYLMGLYKKAGARYFMSMGVHHDNFDLWDSKYNRWNAVNMGPRKDIVGMWKKAAQKHGMKFGISDHLWITYKWFSTSKGSDKDGPMAGVPYDGADPKNFEYYGKCEEVFRNLEWQENWIPEAWKQHWFDRIKDLVDKYEPDLLYCDGHMPFEEHGLAILSHLYNKSAAKNGGITQAVYTSKRPEDSAKGTGICVFDVERGVVESIWPSPWQTDTCIGDWHYNKERVGNYKSPKTVVDLLVDIVSRNGNLMLNFPLPASGMLDNDELTVLDGITRWMAVNSEAIYATRPWKLFGEGPAADAASDKNKKAAAFNEGHRKDMAYEDVRFTTKGKTLYAFVMGWPDKGGQVTIKALASAGADKTGTIADIQLLGHGKVDFKREEAGLKIQLPGRKPCEHAFAFKISGEGLV
ncbi:alpha-L-fucosidase [Flavitalea sp. BT771]|uniref:alpha-L-fucosidase n=1 Tax=Flavitalea sp. BT771 TaxID=3063329 RepID=UPI0026E48FC3|nr:alpha-L-fucosidase [Flavitalea sp. BT771]MDO6430288.1 alpha-L-fucosidase [Flavitalea sp. BT771]MDV6219572.1 alpha-L-fucosidase [Flavitalea sp. BT771]